MKIALLAVAALTLSATAQTTPATTPGLTKLISSAAQSPAHQPAVLVDKDVQQRFAALIPVAKAKGISGATLADFGSYKMQLSVRAVSGKAEVHAHWDDVMMVQQGNATLVTGGTVVDGKAGADGETLGASITGGHSQAIAPGDVLTIRAGTPHQLLLAPGTIYAAVIVKVHEP